MVTHVGRVQIYFGCRAERVLELIVSVLRHVRRQRLVAECHCIRR
jgi:hypothetical protein